MKSDPDTCPECGGRLRERNGQYGRFMGCSNYRIECRGDNSCHRKERVIPGIIPILNS
ncbi:MAG: hypothetical protein HDR02_07645 [Lachnospiraceae bacterium]|nr:hypothetical protein [Lachnospiraceae bacterium]